MAALVSNGLTRTKAGWKTNIEKRGKVEWGLPVLFRNYTLKFLIATEDEHRFWENLAPISIYYEPPTPLLIFPFRGNVSAFYLMKIQKTVGMKF